MLALGLVRPYKELDHAREAGRPRDRRCPARASPATASAFLPEAEIDRALGESTVAVFPYRPEIDQSGALLRALGAGVPAVVYDVGGLGEPVRATAPAASSPPDDVDGLADADARPAARRDALDAARAGAHAHAPSSPGTRPRRRTSPSTASSL